MPDRRGNPEYFLFRAEQARTIAACLKDDFTQQTLVNIAGDYEWVAGWLHAITLHKSHNERAIFRAGEGFSWTKFPI